MPGLTDQGLEIATLADVRAQINAAWRAKFGASMDVSDRSPDGQLIGIHAEIFALLWELLEAIVSSQDPDKAVGAFLRALAALIGTEAAPATLSAVTETLTGTPTTIVPTDSLISTVSTGQQFATVGDATILAATPWAGTTAYATGDRRTNASGIYLCTFPGVSAASGGPTGTDLNVDIPDGSGALVWRFIGAGTGFVDVLARATDVGPVVAVSGDLTSIDNPTGGWQGAYNALDATLGAVAMTDAELRQLMAAELARPGTSPGDAIRVALLDVDKNTNNPVTSAVVFVNFGDDVDADGVPGHSVEAVVRGGSDQGIWDALLANVAAGIRTFGTEIGTSTDSSGAAQTMAFTRTAEIDIWVIVTLTKNPKTYPADGDAQVALAIATNGNARDDGSDVQASWVLAQSFGIIGVLSVPSMPLIGTAPAPVTSTTIAVTTRQKAVFDTSRITVISSDGIP